MYVVAASAVPTPHPPTPHPHFATMALINLVDFGNPFLALL